jgi:hypothetical protein
VELTCFAHLQAQKCVIEECFTLISTKTLHKEGCSLDYLNYSHMNMTMDIGLWSGVSTVTQKSLQTKAVLDLLKELAIKIEVPESNVREEKLEGGCDYTVTVKR